MVYLDSIKIHNVKLRLLPDFSAHVLHSHLDLGQKILSEAIQLNTEISI